MNLRRDVIVRNVLRLSQKAAVVPRGSGPHDTQSPAAAGMMDVFDATQRPKHAFLSALRERPDAYDGVVAGCSGKLSKRMAPRCAGCTVRLFMLGWKCMTTPDWSADSGPMWVPTWVSCTRRLDSKLNVNPF